MSYEHLRGVMGGIPHITTDSTDSTEGAGEVIIRPHLSLVPDEPGSFAEFAAFDAHESEPLTNEEWQERALCAQTDPEAFFPEKGGSTREAKKICLRCPVRNECLEYALAHDERFGIWGGLSERERRRLKRGIV